MTKKKRRAGAATPNAAKNKCSSKHSICIIALRRSAVKLALTADLVLLLAALGSLNIPAALLAVLALNPLCGKIMEVTE